MESIRLLLLTFDDEQGSQTREGVWIDWGALMNMGWLAIACQADSGQNFRISNCFSNCDSIPIFPLSSLHGGHLFARALEFATWTQLDG